MPAAPEHREEQRRLASLDRHDLLDAGTDAELDALTTAAARALGMPAALVSLVGADRQVFASRRGLDGVLGYDTRQTPRELSFCAHVVAAEQPLVVADATADERFADNPLVTGTEHLRAYAGAPVLDRDGLPLGALCVLDRFPRALDDADVAVLTELAASVAEVLQRRLDQPHVDEPRPDR